jgi:phosphatidylglycerol---prolipoprotein diacylglyceryl transferase
VFAQISWPILERIPIVGDLAVSPHGIGTALGFLFGALVMIRRAEIRGLGPAQVPDVSRVLQDLLFRAGIGAIIGARLFYVLNNLDRYVDDPIRILMVWEGGLTFLGGVVGAIVAAYPVMRRERYRPALLFDSAAPGLAVGLAIGRLGDLVIGDHLGEPAAGWPLAWRCTGNLWDASTNSLRLGDPVAPLPAEALAGRTQGCFDVAVHQTALYDLMNVAPLFAVLLLLERRPRWDGFFIAVTVYWYALGRFTMDFLREDRLILGLTGSQYTMLLAALAVTAFLVWRRPWQQRTWAWPGRGDAEPGASEAVRRGSGSSSDAGSVTAPREEEAEESTRST